MTQVLMMRKRERSRW